MRGTAEYSTVVISNCFSYLFNTDVYNSVDYSGSCVLNAVDYDCICRHFEPGLNLHQRSLWGTTGSTDIPPVGGSSR